MVDFAERGSSSNEAVRRTNATGSTNRQPLAETLRRATDIDRPLTDRDDIHAGHVRQTRQREAAERTSPVWVQPCRGCRVVQLVSRFLNERAVGIGLGFNGRGVQKSMGSPSFRSHWLFLRNEASSAISVRVPDAPSDARKAPSVLPSGVVLPTASMASVPKRRAPNSVARTRRSLFGGSGPSAAGTAAQAAPRAASVGTKPPPGRSRCASLGVAAPGPASNAPVRNSPPR